MYSPAAMLKPPARSPAIPASTMACGSTDEAPAMPMIRLTLDTSPSLAPKTVGRRMLEPRVSWGLAGGSKTDRRRDHAAIMGRRGVLRDGSWNESPMSPPAPQCSRALGQLRPAGEPGETLS